MTIVTLFLYVGLVAALLTGLIFGHAKVNSTLQIAFFKISLGFYLFFLGFVKAVDPLGTAYKMEQYFTAFEDTCNGSF
ncbi:MAG: hypothetical protein IPO78_08675 [Saprospiraceae bacterium]|nr:hypothetical protein [Saprospiraceae bacterium]